MSILGKILKTGLDVVTSPIEVVKDVADTMEGNTNQESHTARRLRRLGEDLEEVRDELDEL
jgi:hypothetical protein